MKQTVMQIMNDAILWDSLVLQLLISSHLKWCFYSWCYYFWISHGVQLQSDRKVKCTHVQALRLCTGRMAHRGSRGIALFFLVHSTRRGWGLSTMPQPLFAPGKDPVPIVQKAGWAPGPVWTGVENLASTRIRSLDCPACSQSLYRLRHLAHTVW